MTQFASWGWVLLFLPQCDLRAEDLFHKEGFAYAIEDYNNLITTLFFLQHGNNLSPLSVIIYVGTKEVKL